jgi:hypothetical protein
MFVTTVLEPGHAQAQTFQVLYWFTGRADGGPPFFALLRDAAGNLYGTGETDGDFVSGVVFKLDAETRSGFEEGLVLVLQTRT